MTAARQFASVKLPESLVQQARQAAQPLRRSAAGQIEYWATLGRVVEHSGLTVQEARAAIENFEAITRINAFGADSQANDLAAEFMESERNGSLAERVRQVITDNRNKIYEPQTPTMERLTQVRERVLESSANGELQKSIRKVVAQNRKLAIKQVNPL